MTEIQERSILSSDNKHELFCRVYLNLLFSLFLFQPSPYKIECDQNY